MAIVVKDRVKVSTATTGTGTLTLGSAETDFQAFSVIGDGNQTYYAIKSDAGWEVGIGTYTHSGTTLSRDTILESSNSGSAVSLTGTSTVFTTYPAERSTFNDQGIAKEYTATGSITAGKPVILKADGTAEQVVKETTTNNYDPQDATSEHTITGSDHWYTSGVEYNSTAGVLLFSNSNNSTYYPMITPATANADGTLNMGTSTIVESTVTYGGYVTSNTQANEFLYTWSWAGNTQGVRMKAGTIGGTSTAPTVTLGSMVQQDDRYTYYINTCYDSNVDRYCTAFYQSNDNGQTMGEVYAYTTSVSGTTPTLQNANGTRIFTSYNGSGGYSSQMTLCAFDASANRVLVRVNGLTSDGGSTYKVMLQTIEVTTTGISGASNTPVHLDSTLSSSSPHAQSEATGCLKYDPDGERMLVGYALRGASDALTRGKLKLANVSSTSCALGAETTVGSDPCKNLAFGYDENIDKFGIYISSGSFGTTCDFYNMTYDGSDNITLSSKVVVNGSYGYRINNNTGTIMPYVPTAFAMYSAITDSTTTYLYSFQSKNETTTINLDSTNYLGLASTPASNGEKVNINLPELSINNSQSGLTIGDDYFCNTSGEIKKFISTSEDTSTVVATKASAGTQVLGAGTVKYPATCYDTNSDRFVTIYTDDGNSGYGTAVVSQISNATTGAVTYGTPVVFNAGDTDPSSVYNRAIAFDSNTNKVLIAFQDTADSRKGKAIVGTVDPSDNSITFGSEAEFESGEANRISVVFDSNENRFVIIYNDADDSNKGKAVVATVSGTSVSFGSLATFHNDQTRDSASCFDPDNNKVLIIYNDDTDTSGQGIVGTVSGTNITFGSSTTFDTDNIDDISVDYDSNVDKFFVAYQDAGTSSYPHGIVATVSGTSVSFGTAITLTSAVGAETISIFDPDLQKTCVAYPSNNSKGVLHYINITGTTPSIIGSLDFNDTDIGSANMSGAYDPDNDKMLLTFKDANADLNQLMINTAYGSTYTQTDAQYIGEAISTTALKLKETPTDIIFGKASTTIAKGNPVLVEADGDFAKVATTTSSTTNSGTYSQGSISKIDDVVQDKWSMDVASDGTTYGFAYRETAGQTNFVLGTRSGETITWGTPITLASFNSLTQIVKYNPEQDVFIITYTNQTTHKHLAIAVSYSGTTATAGSEIELLASPWTSGGTDMSYTQVYDSNSKNNVFICHGANDSLSNKTTAIVITASGTTLTAGTENANTSAGGTYYQGCDILNGKIVLYYRDDSVYYPNVMVLEVSGNTVTFGTSVVVNSENYGGFCTPLYNPNYTNKAILFGKIKTANNYYSYASLAISGTTITVSNFSDGNISSDNCYIESFGKVADYSDYTGNYIAVYSDSDDSYKQCNRFCTTTNGETLTVGSENKDSAGSSLFYSGVVSNDVNDKSVTYFGDYANDDIEYYVVNPTYSNTVTTTTINLTTENFIGFSENAVSANEASKVKVVNIDDNQTGLTAGKIYYVKNDGTLSTTAESGKVVEVGKAISATKLLIRG